MSEGYVRVWYDVDCAECGETSDLMGGLSLEGEDPPSVSLKARGWKRQRIGWVCPACVARPNNA